MDDETTTAVEAAKAELIRALGLRKGEPSASRLEGLPTEEVLEKARERLQARSPVAAAALDLALADFRKHGLAGDAQMIGKVAACYIEDLAAGLIEPLAAGTPPTTLRDDDETP